MYIYIYICRERARAMKRFYHRLLTIKLVIMTQIPTFNVFLKNIYRIKTHNLFKLTNIVLLFRSFVNVK